jgi:hypothetical protein
MPGTTLENVANIFFDFNPAVITEPSVLLAEFSTGVGRPSTGSGRQLLLFPDPVADVLNLRTSLAVPYLVELITSDGRVVRSGQYSSTQLILPVDDLAEGSYLCRITDATGRSSARFIKASSR